MDRDEDVEIVSGGVGNGDAGEGDDDSANESKDELVLSEGDRENRFVRIIEGRRDIGVGEGAREYSESSISSISSFFLFREAERPTFRIELNALDALALKPLDCFDTDSVTGWDSLLRLTFMTSMISESSPGELPRTVISLL